MKIIFNPLKGKPIGAGYNDFVYEGEKIEAHLPGEVKQYEENKAQTLLDIFGFLTEVTPDEAKKIAETPKQGTFKCKYCDFSTDLKVALIGHTKKHKEEVAKENAPRIDPDIVPVAGGERITPQRSERESSVNEKAMNPSDGVDKDGVVWYGGGAVEENRSFEKIKPDNQGHFGKQNLTE